MAVSLYIIHKTNKPQLLSNKQISEMFLWGKNNHKVDHQHNKL